MQSIRRGVASNPSPLMAAAAAGARFLCRMQAFNAGVCYPYGSALAHVRGGSAMGRLFAIITAAMVLFWAGRVPADVVKVGLLADFTGAYTMKPRRPSNA